MKLFSRLIQFYTSGLLQPGRNHCKSVVTV